MSFVSGVVLCAACYEPELPKTECGGDGDPIWLDVINEWLGRWQTGAAIKMVESGFGGDKHPQIRVAGGGFNYFPEDEFAAFVLSQRWEWPESLVLIIQPENGEARIFRPIY